MYFENRKPQGAFGYDEYYFRKKNRRLKEVSKKFFERFQATERRVPTFYDIFMFNCLWSKTYTSKADWTYWEEKGWIDKEFYYDVKLAPLKKIFGRLMKCFIERAGARYLKKE